MGARSASRRSANPSLGGYRTLDTRLREVREVRRFESADDLAVLLPPDLPSRFTTADLATRAAISRDHARRMAFCLRALELSREVADRDVTTPRGKIVASWTRGQSSRMKLVQVTFIPSCVRTF
jgi:hypothetical protein